MVGAGQRGWDPEGLLGPCKCGEWKLEKGALIWDVAFSCMCLESSGLETVKPKVPEGLLAFRFLGRQRSHLQAWEGRYWKEERL